MLALAVLRVPLAFAMMAVGLIGIYAIGGMPAMSGLLRSIPYSSVVSYGLIALPAYLAMSEFAARSNIVDGMFRAFHNWLHWLPGGLGIAVQGACAGFACISGSSGATVAAIGRLSIPELRRAGWKWRPIAGAVAAGGVVGLLIPPSAAFIVFGILTETSIGDLFVAGFVPGVLLSILFSITVLCWALLRPEDIPHRKALKLPPGERMRSLRGFVKPLLLIGTVLGGIYSGLTTVTEAAGLGAMVALTMLALEKTTTWRTIMEAVQGAGRVGTMIMTIVIGATIFGKFITISGLPFVMAKWMMAADFTAAGFVIAVMVVVLMLGCFMESNAIFFVTLPFLHPLLTQFHVDMIWFGVLYVIAIEIGTLTPPVGFNAFVFSSIAPGARITHIFQGIGVFLIADLLLLILVFLVPDLATWLPNSQRK